MRVWPTSRRWRIALVVVAIVLVAGAGVFAYARRGGAPNLTTAEVTRGDYVDIVEIRGVVKPLKSIIITAPMQSGELQILRIAKNGAPIKAGEVAVEFDGSALRRTVQEKQSELKQAQAEYDQARAKSSIARGEDSTALVHSDYDVRRATLDVSAGEELISKVEAATKKLALADAEQRKSEATVKDDANRKSTMTGFSAQESRIAKVKADLARAERGLEQLQMKAPADGVVNIMPNWNNRSSGGTSAEYRPGDSTWPGAEIVELPNLSSVHLEARLDESDRGRLRVGQTATIRVDAIPDHDYPADVSTLSVLARVDFSSWPPVKNFDIKLNFREGDDRLRPGMSAAARIAVGRLPDMLLVPADAVFIVDGLPVVYRLEGRAFVAVQVQIVKRSKDQAAIKGPLRPGDRVALTKPVDARGGASK
jgi:multidrug efflux pump subunit AcrA (membrane-fusion protein)